MAIKWFDIEDGQIVIHTEGEICASKKDLIHSDVLQRIVGLYVRELRSHDSPLLDALGLEVDSEEGRHLLMSFLRTLCENPLAQVANTLPYAKCFLERLYRDALNEFIEGLYSYWRAFDRFLVLHSDPVPSSFDPRPHRAFNATVEELTHLVRLLYRDLRENVTGDHPRVYHQVPAGCDVGIVAIRKESGLPAEYGEILGQVPFIRQVWIAPPMIIDPPMNTRTGQFQKVDRNPLSGLTIQQEHWLCYPARVGSLVIFVYFHQRFVGLGCSLSNLFDLATDEQIAAGPDAVYLYGVPSEALASFGDLPTVFYEPEGNRLLVAAIPRENRFGYFGYLKKMTLTLHNIIMMKRGRMPYHGAMVRILLREGKTANILLIGDTATGKSETLEAFRVLGKDHIRDLRIIADDMGSLEIGSDGRVAGYGTEIGAFVRLDDLQEGYVFRQIDRAIIMSPQKVNARVVLPVTTISEVLHGYPVDFLLYANNYEEVNESRPVVERFDRVEHALEVFREGRAMAKGTTTSTGLVQSYFANPFGPPQYREMHEPLAARVFRAAFDAGVFVGQIRTRLAIPGYETKGPEEAARALLRAVSNKEVAGCQPAAD